MTDSLLMSTNPSNLDLSPEDLQLLELACTALCDRYYQDATTTTDRDAQDTMLGRALEMHRLAARIHAYAIHAEPPFQLNRK